MKVYNCLVDILNAYGYKHSQNIELEVYEKIMECPKDGCNNKGTYNKEGSVEFTRINIENSASTFNDWDQDLELKCNKCGKVFHEIW